MGQIAGNEATKDMVFDFWNDASCGETVLLKGDTAKAQFINQMSKRYEVEPYILKFAGFENVAHRKVLEIGVGLGADHQKFAENNAILYGVDLTPRAIEHTQKRFDIFNLKSNLSVGDAENLSYPDNFFDFVYSWGVIHHSPQTPKAVNEIFRVLNHGGVAKVMIYHKYSFIGYMLWLRYGLMRLKPFTPLSEIYSRYLESPGTKAYSTKEAKKMFSDFSAVDIDIVLSPGDILSGHTGQRHKGVLLSLARKVWPAAIIKRFFNGHGLFMLISAKKL